MNGKRFNPSGIKRAINYLIEKICPFDVKTFQIIIGVVTALVLGAVLVLGWLSSRKIKEVVTKDFNQQQLVLAQYAAKQIENSLALLKREQSLLGLSPSMQYREAVFMSKRMGIAFSSIKNEGCLEIRFVEDGNRTHIMNESGYRDVRVDDRDRTDLEWARRISPDEVLMKDVVPVADERGAHALVMKMALPVRQVSVDESHPRPTYRFAGVLIMTVDVTSLIGKTIQGIRSGKTGYAWVIDDRGTFLYHPEKEFIGKNAFEARKEKRPTISFDRINAIQQDLMLAGKEGTSWYVSGWHRGQEGEMKKLIAYAPIRFGASGNQLWSVAVVAPTSEVEGALNDIQIRQFLLEGIVVLAILSGGLLIIGIMIRWSSSLSEEVKKVTAELKKSENRYRSLIENANDIIFTADRDGDIVSINQAGRSFFQKAEKEIIGSNIGEICFNQDSAVAQFVAIDEVFKTKSSRQIMYPVNINGNEYWLSTNFSGLLDEKGDIFAVLGISRNITQLKKMEEQMYYTEKLASIGTLAAGVAHEINNPLAIILGFADFLVEKAPPGTESHEMLRTIEKQGLNAKRVVENLLTFARFKEQREERVDINKNIEDVLAVVGNTLTLNKIFMEKSLSESLPPVQGTEGELQQVFFNVVNNAISAMRGGGMLRIATRTIPVDDEQCVEIRISDTGKGIKKEHRTRIFDPLFTTKKVGEGTGLGLFVSYGIIAKHGGTLSFETKTEEESGDTGTTFIIAIPVNKTNG